MTTTSVRTVTGDQFVRLTQMPTSSDPDRGSLVLSWSSAVRNMKADLIAEYVSLLLETGAWRSYTYPSGDHIEWKACEFDYFLASTDTDPTMINNAVRGVGSRELLVRMAQASDVRATPEERRTVDQVIADVPQVGPWLEKYGLRALATLGVHRLLAKPAELAKYMREERAALQLNVFRAAASDASDLPEAIVRNLLASDARAHLAAAVHGLLDKVRDETGGMYRTD